MGKLSSLSRERRAESGEFHISLSISIETVPITTDFGVIFSYFLFKKTLIPWTVEANQADSFNKVLQLSDIVKTGLKTAL
jgi:hypothetical protein